MEIGKLLEDILPKERIKVRLIDLVAYASDAGFYYLRPKAVVQPVAESEIIALFRFSHQHQVPLTFRTGGTSLSGQAITDGILVDLSQYWNRVLIEDDGALVRVQPGITGSIVNGHLKRYKRKIGPDPSSIDAAMMGGILSNNSSGMCCGVKLNSYHTTKHIRFILPDGKTFTTEHVDDYARFEKECSRIYNAIKGMQEQLKSNTALYELIRRKYETKNTVGYSLNAFIDHEHPLDVLAHLLIGAEGTLGFIAEAVMKTVPDYPYKTTAFLYFPDIYAACQAIIPLTVSGAEAVELMDRASLRSIDSLKGVPERLKTLPETAAALLVEFQANSLDELHAKKKVFLSSASSLSMLEVPLFTEDVKEQAFFWKLRKGMFPAVGAVRASGTTVILEDIAFPVAKLGDAILDLQQLFKKYAYHEAIIFGHAKDGNIHFVVTQAFHTAAEIERYDLFMQDVVKLVVETYDGTLKAEHGTGRNMAPFIETEWGGEAYQLMKQLKSVIDPQNLLNPGVIINENKKAHIANLKPLPSVEQEVDKCIECGYCEHKCPSRNITLTPRQRIVVRRELAGLKSKGNKQDFDQLVKEYQYDGLDTCAVDGLCATACPVDINTGDLVKRLRRESHSKTANGLALIVAKNFGATAFTVGMAVKAGGGMNRIFGESTMRNITGGLKKVIPAVPLWSNQLQATKGKIEGSSNGSVVYFPTCINRMMGGAKDNKKSVPQTFMSVSAKVGIEILVPDDINNTCCGQLFSSKGYNAAYVYTSNETVRKLWKWTQGGELPVVLDVSSCTHTLQHCRTVLTDENKAYFDQLSIIDSIDYLHDHVLPKLKVVHKKDSIILHPVCTLKKMGLEGKLFQVADRFAHEVEVPLMVGCCGMAGDRGFLFPELTAAATAPEAAEVKSAEYSGYYSTAKTCEMAMSDAVSKNYESILYLADECL
ncbi:MAG: FAD-binding and (Fe-S)-binding domain-containing protein [Candidatus Pedobacter colombiensis]|uniref:D-lactate dehydrogenase (cytochrome) n=1 Tax=Candidatus Pedobacter colombiensis TaxID=3121371 RepID=A0AAJ5W6I0_9SPHI|nr:FAD-binding and (Fe-S)-binding domain-containing protein [Pedobacter sp.]WEK18455.1 MAG: FAD-binding and (Fe-S)-binding domain-containing protein [Pedobacter sp.]